jgi:hypothetical protein
VVFHNWSAAAFLYPGLHGTYTLLLLIKQFVFADKRFARYPSFLLSF